MSVGDLLSGIGRGVATAGRVAGAVLEPIAKRTAEVVSGEAPELDEERRQRQYQAQDQQLTQRRDWLQRQMELDDKYKTLTPEQRQQVDHEYQTLGAPAPAQSPWQAIHNALHPKGMVRQAAPQFSGNAAPDIGTAAADEQNAERLAQARSHPRPASPSAQYFDSYAQSLGLPDSSQMTPEQWEKAITEQKKAGRAPVQHHWSPVKLNGNLYMHDPATNEMKFVGAEDNVTVHRGVQNVTQADGTILQIPVTTYTSKQSGKPIVDEDGNPIQTLEPDNHPDNPSSGETKPKNAQGGAPKATPGGILRNHPRTGASPVNPPSPGGIPGARVVGSHGSPLYKAEMAEAGKQMPILEAAEGSIKDYMANKVFDGPGDLSLQHAFFTATQPSTGFRMTKVQQDMLQNSRSWKDSWEAKLRHVTTGQWYTDDQREQIAKAATDAIAEKKKVFQGIISGAQPGNAPASAGGEQKEIHYKIVNGELVPDAGN